MCGELWDASDRVVTSRLTFVETAAALAMARRMGRITADQLADGRRRQDELWSGMAVVELDEALMIAAANAAVTYGLRGYDAVHCVAAASVRGSTTVAAAGDADLLTAWREEGVAVIDVNATS